MFFMFYPSRIVLTILFLIVITIQGVEISIAHSGGTDSFGCHAGSKPYHCHGGPDNSNYNLTDGERVLLDRYQNGYTPEKSYKRLLIPYGVILLVGFVAGCIRQDEINQNKNFNENKLRGFGFGVFWAIITFIILSNTSSPISFN
jgi:hypothetical protein